MANREKYPLDVMEKALREAKGLRSHAAKMLGCSTTTVSDYIGRHKELQLAEREVLEEVLDFAEQALWKNVKAGREQSLFFLLRCKGKERGYVERHIVESSGLDGGPIQHVHRVVTPKDVKKMTDEELEEFVRGECGPGPD